MNGFCLLCHLSCPSMQKQFCFVCDICSLETLRAGLANLTRLTDVRFCDDSLGLSNPVCSNPLYRAAVVSIVPTLSRLDGMAICICGSFDQWVGSAISLRLKTYSTFSCARFILHQSSDILRGYQCNAV